MNCPRCSTSLTEHDREGITVDRCQRCRGVWLDRGELEKLLARASDEQHDDDDHGDHDHEDRDWKRRFDDHGPDADHQPRRSRRGWMGSLGALFD
ncbi:MAG: zf-TFIIB domain-containing protein [Planctomycetes bacterium]|nr:zf-TFIIB domain-containing protein [Planctomycetota bacterium]